MRKLMMVTIFMALLVSACAGAAAPATPAEVLPETGQEEATAAVTTAATEAAAQVTEEAQATEPATEAVMTETPTVEGAATETPAERPDLAATSGPAEGTLPSGIVTYAIVPEETTVTYEVGEVFLNQNNAFNNAVGKTSGVNGQIQVNFDQPDQSTLGPFTVDISQFQSDSGRRDGALRDRFLESAQFPTVTFTPTTVTGLPEQVEAGVSYPLQITGDLTIREVTLPATFDATVQVDAQGLTGQATTTFLMSDFGFGPIDILNMLQTEDEVKITVDVVARPQ